MKDLVLEMFRLMDAGDWSRLPEFFGEAVVYERPGYPPIHGLEDLLDFYANRRRIRVGRHAIDEVVVDARAAVALGEIVATMRDGSQTRVRFADLYRLEGSRIIHRHTYLDLPAV